MKLGVLDPSPESLSVTKSRVEFVVVMIMMFFAIVFQERLRGLRLLLS